MSISSRISIPGVLRDLSITDPKAWSKSLWNIGGSAALAGEVVTEDTAMTYSTFWNAVYLIASTVGNLPLHLYKSIPEGKEIARDHPAYNVICVRANPYMTSAKLRQTIMGHLLVWGNAYIEKVRNGYGDVVELWPITPDRVSIKTSGTQLLYEVDLGGGGKKVLNRDTIIHIAGFGFNGLTGYSIIELARKNLSLSMAMETYASLYFSNGAHPSIIIKHPEQLSSTASDNLQKSLSNRYSGLGQSHRLMLLEEGMDAMNIGVKPEDSQFLESRQFSIVQIAQWFNLPPHKLKDLTRSSFNNIESEQISFATDSILPWSILIEQELGMQTLSAKDYGKYYLKHNMDGLMRADARSRAEYYRSLFSVGGITISQICAKEEFDPPKGKYVNEPFVPMNMIPLSLLEDFLKSKQIDNNFKKDTQPTTEKEPDESEDKG